MSTNSPNGQESDKELSLASAVTGITAATCIAIVGTYITKHTDFFRSSIQDALQNAGYSEKGTTEAICKELGYKGTIQNPDGFTSRGLDGIDLVATELVSEINEDRTPKYIYIESGFDVGFMRYETASTKKTIVNPESVQGCIEYTSEEISKLFLPHRPQEGYMTFSITPLKDMFDACGLKDNFRFDSGLEQTQKQVQEEQDKIEKRRTCMAQFNHDSLINGRFTPDYEILDMVQSQETDTTNQSIFDDVLEDSFTKTIDLVFE